MIETYEAFLDRLISDGIAACQRDYADDEDMLRGAVAGFETCRGKDAAQLGTILGEAKRDTMQVYRDEGGDYWYWRCRELEIHWVCNVVSAVLLTSGKPVIVEPTAGGVQKAAEILRV